MSELGRFLSEARTEKKLSLADVEAHTRIRQKYLEALETGDYAGLPRGATSRGFLRIYAHFLGVDVDQATRLYLAESGDKGPELPTVQDGRAVDYRPLEVELHAEPPRTWWPWVVAVLVVAVMAAGGWAFLNNKISISLPQPNWDLLAALGPAPSTTTPTVTATPTKWVVRVTPTAPAAPAGSAVQAQPTSDLLPYPTPTVQPTVTPTARPTATVEVQQANRISLKAHIGQTSWIRVIGDGQVIEETLLNPGIDRTWEATQTLTIRTGNGAGVDLALNGQPLGTMGSVGQVVDKAWMVDQGQVVEVTPTGQPAVAPVAKQPAQTPLPTPAG
jgi:cytoskeletal protein RodZ